MVLLVDHDAERLLAIHDHRAADAFGRVLATDEMTFHEHLLLERGKILEQLRKGILHFRKRFHLRLDLLEDLGAFGLFRPAGKGALAQIARQPHATADDDLVMRAFAAQPFPGARHDLGKLHRQPAI